MNATYLARLSIPMQINPECQFTLVGHIFSIDRSLNFTTLVLRVVDRMKPSDNMSEFTLICRGQIKTLFDKFVRREDLFNCTGQLWMKDGKPEFEVRHFSAWRGAKQVWEETPMPTYVKPTDIDNAY